MSQGDSSDPEAVAVEAFLLTRGWRDTPDGLELSLWGASEGGPVHVRIVGQPAVCFIEHDRRLPANTDCTRKALDLCSLSGKPVDGLYFRQQRELIACRDAGVELLESDIKPVDRYLMERFIRAGFTIQGTPTQAGQERHFLNPVLKAADVKPDPVVLSIDIETRAHSNEIYSIAGACMARPGQSSLAAVFMRGVAEHEKRDDYDLYYCANERSLLSDFFAWLQAIDPDILVGWSVVNFDLDRLDAKCRSLGMRFDIGRGHEAATVLQPGSPGSPKVARVPGRAVLDGIELLKAGFWSFDSFSLENVARELLGAGKLITPEQNKVEEINRLFRHDKPRLADYNLRDCALVNDIFVKAELVPFAVQRAQLTGLAIDRLGGAVAAFDNLYLPRLHRRGHVAPDVASHPDAVASPGGHVMDSRPGLYRNVLVLDFKSLYPSIIRTFLIDPLGLAQPGEDAVPGFLDATFSRDSPILPSLVEALWAARDKAKRERNPPLSQAIKIIMNSLYGVLGSTGCRFFSPQLASSITRRGHEIITDSRRWIEDAGHEVIYGDTDSLFVLVGDERAGNEADRIGRELTVGLNDWWRERLQREYRLESRLEVEFETRYARFLMPTVRGMTTGSKKRYAGLIEGDEPRLVIKGLEAVRTDWTPLAREFQRELLNRIFRDQPIEDYVRETAASMQRGELDHALVYRKRLRRDVSAYLRNVPPHVQAARKLRRPGNWVRYVITRNGPEPLEHHVSPIDYQHYLDRQLAPAADGVLQFLDTRFATLTDAQLQMF